MKDWNAMSDEDFRQEARAFFAKHYPEHLRYAPHRLHWNEIGDWYLTLSKHGWIAPAWPVEHGGMGLDPGKLIILIEEQEAHGVARTPDQGVIMVGPLLIQQGNDEQKKRFLPKILSGEHVWCQGYSEPNSGSDLASLRTEAVLDGDDFVVNGQKTWSTLAQDGTHMFLLVRTDKTARKQEGISFLLVDMKTPGITVRPMKILDGHEHFCEVFFDNVRVPRANMVGELNKGWGVAKALLSFERLFIGSPKTAQSALTHLEQLARLTGAMEDATFRTRLMRFQLDVADLNALYREFSEQVRRGEKLGADISILKIFSSETYARLADFIVETGGSGALSDGPSLIGNEQAEVVSTFYASVPTTIYGGTNEIQRNIIATGVLGLPSS
jgi:alkylation response protein AidB-like acyl-CoA dehydrogenase